MPSVGPYCSARAEASAATRAISAATSSAGNVLVSGRPPASEMTSGRAVMRHQVAHRGRLHALRAAREQPGVALEVARGRPATRPCRGVRRRGPGPLASRLSSCRRGHPSRRMDFLLDLLQGAGIAAAIGIRPFLPVLLAGALASADLGIDFDGTDFAFLEEAGSCSRVRRASSCSTLVGRRAGREALERPPPLYALGGLALALGALLGARRRWPTTATRSGGHGRRASPARRSGLQAARSLFAPRAPRASTPRRPRALPLYARGRRRSSPRACRSSSRRSRCSSLGGLAVAARRRPPPRGREVRRPAHPAVSRDRAKLVLASSTRMKPAMLERAVAAGQAPALSALMERGPLRRRLRRRLPVRHAGLLGVDRHRDGPGPPPDPVDELVPPRRGPLRRVRDELQRPRAPSASSARSPTRSTT